MTGADVGKKTVAAAVVTFPRVMMKTTIMIVMAMIMHRLQLKVLGNRIKSLRRLTPMPTYRSNPFPSLRELSDGMYLYLRRDARL